MTLLESPSGAISLEYDLAERALVQARLDAIAPVAVTRHAMYE